MLGQFFSPKIDLIETWHQKKCFCFITMIYKSSWGSQNILSRKKKIISTYWNPELTGNYTVVIFQLHT